LKSYFPVVLELCGKEHQLPLLLSVLGQWTDPRKLRRADRRLVRRVLRDHSAGSEQQQNEIIARIRSAQLLCDDEALITPSAIPHVTRPRDEASRRATQDRSQLDPDSVPSLANSNSI